MGRAVRAESDSRGVDELPAPRRDPVVESVLELALMARVLSLTLNRLWPSPAGQEAVDMIASRAKAIEARLLLTEAGTAVRIEFTTVSGGAGDVSFGALLPRPDLSDVVVSSTVRPAWGIFQPVSPWARVKLGANATDTASFALYVTAR